MSDQVSEVTPQQQIADLQNELRETQIQLQKLRAAAWGAADIFRREAEEDCGNGRFIATPTMVEILWRELNGIPEDLDLLRWARENELADLREECQRLRELIGTVRTFCSQDDRVITYGQLDRLRERLAQLDDVEHYRSAPATKTEGGQ